MMRPHVFVINLKRSPGRRVEMAARLDALGMPYSFFEGVDGSVTDTLHHPAYDRKRRLRYFGRDLRAGEIGCLLSHRNLYQHMVDNNIPAAVVLEDDTFLTPDFPSVIDAVMESKKKWDMVRFLEGAKAERLSRKVAALTGRYFLTRPPVSGGAYGYLLTLKAARAFLARMETNYVPVDIVHSYVWETGVETFGVVPSPVAPDRETDSTIGEARFDKTLDITGAARIFYPVTRFGFKLYEMAGKRCSALATRLRDAC